MVKIKTCVFISGQGSNLKNLVSYSRDKSFPIKISLVVSDNKNANGIKYAKKYKIPYVFVNTKSNNYENKIIHHLKKNKITFICLAGYMKIISEKIIKYYDRKIINIHPSLLPKFKGLNTYARVLENKEKKTGCTVHFVTEKLDSGKIILKKFFYIDNNDNVKTLKRKTQILEYNAFSEAIIRIMR